MIIEPFESCQSFDSIIWIIWILRITRIARTTPIHGGTELGSRTVLSWKVSHGLIVSNGSNDSNASHSDLSNTVGRFSIHKIKKMCPGKRLEKPLFSNGLLMPKSKWHASRSKHKHFALYMLQFRRFGGSWNLMNTLIEKVVRNHPKSELTLKHRIFSTGIDTLDRFTQSHVAKIWTWCCVRLCKTSLVASSPCTCTV